MGIRGCCCVDVKADRRYGDDAVASTVAWFIIVVVAVVRRLGDCNACWTRSGDNVGNVVIVVEEFHRRYGDLAGDGNKRE